MSSKKKAVRVCPHRREWPWTSKLRVAGIDPGLHGGIALIQNHVLRNVAPMPLRYERKSDGSYRTLPDEWSLTDFIRMWAPDVLFAEDVYARQDQGVVSMFSFGLGKGQIMGTCAGLGVDLRWVSPQRWKGQVGVMPPRRPEDDEDAHKARLKALSIHKACTLFPDDAKRLQKDGPAEATLIAVYGVLSLARTRSEALDE